FQRVLKGQVHSDIEPPSPDDLLLFSDCAFLTHDSLLDAAVSSTILMRKLLSLQVPVRIGLGFGTWHLQRFLIDSSKSQTVTQTLFYGTGVVRANRAEKHGGKGCRIFVHPSITEAALADIRTKVRVLPTPEGSKDAPVELNYLAPG